MASMKSGFLFFYLLARSPINHFVSTLPWSLLLFPDVCVFFCVCCYLIRCKNNLPWSVCYLFAIWDLSPRHDGTIMRYSHKCFQRMLSKHILLRWLPQSTFFVRVYSHFISFRPYRWLAIKECKKKQWCNLNQNRSIIIIFFYSTRYHYLKLKRYNLKDEQEHTLKR